MNSFHRLVGRSGWELALAGAIAMVLAFGSSLPLHGQNLGWEGETGIFVTPLAYTASSETQKIHPVVGYHFFDVGPVIGDFHEASIEVGIGKRIEIGYTHEFHAYGENMPPEGNDLSPLWENGFEIFNGKFNAIPENFKKTNWIPAISFGFIARTDVRNVGNYMVEGGGTSGSMNGKANGDIYMVGTKLVPLKHAGPFAALLFNGGVRGTNAELFGMGGNAPDWKARGFGAAGFAVKLPYKASAVFASEASQQPHHPYYFDGSVTGVPALNIPTTLTYAVRFTPTPKSKLNVDFGVAQVAGQVYGTEASGINLKARHQFGLQVAYGF